MVAKMFVPLVFLGAVVSLSLANDPAVCSEPLNEGSGDEKKLMYSYVQDMDLCQPFFYKGQEGNGNLFTSDRECMQNCSSKFSQLYPATDEEVCNLPVDYGSCMAMLLMYHYDAVEKNCRLFHYGGCQGNGNRFDTREKCQKTCMARLGRSGIIPNPDEATADAGLIVGILGGIIFGVSVIIGVVFIVKERKQKAKRKGGKQDPDDGTEMSPTMGTV